MAPVYREFQDAAPTSEMRQGNLRKIVIHDKELF
jgi:hypothetical protein